MISAILPEGECPSLHHNFMQQALSLARQAEGRTAPNPPVGAVIVADGRVVGSGFHPCAGMPHAEIYALMAAGEQAHGADMYVTLEPCSHHGRTGPCCDALIAAGIRRVFVGMEDPNPLVKGRGIERMRAAGIVVTPGICEQDCRFLVAPFVKHVTTGRPLVILKAAITLDGRTATASGESQWLTNPQSRQHVHAVRNRVDAIMVGVGTVLQDNPRLTTRLPEGGRDPLRVIVDSCLRIPLDAAILHLSSAVKTVVATTALACPEKMANLQQNPRVDVVVLPQCSAQVDLVALFTYLGTRQVQSVLVEGGATLNSALYRQRLIDRFMVYVAPKIMGGDDGKALFGGPGAKNLNELLSLENMRLQRFEDDLLIEGDVAACLPA